MFDLSFNTTQQSTLFDTTDRWDLLIIGGGPAGLNAALYAQRKGLKVGLIAKDIGGQLHNTTDVDNYLGFQRLEGKTLSNQFLNHVKALDVPIKSDVFVTQITPQKALFSLQLSNGKTLFSKTIIIATGSKPRKLNIPGEETFSNRGVSYCTTCDAPFFKDKHVIVSGGGNSAAEAVLDLSYWAKHITVVHRSRWRADKLLLDKISNLPNVTIHLETQIINVDGDEMMRGVHVLDKNTQSTRFIHAEGLFIEIGTIPMSDLVTGFVQLNANHEIVVDAMQMSSIPGLFAAGDVSHQPFKQIIIAAAEGAKAALAVTQYINQKTKESY